MQQACIMATTKKMLRGHSQQLGCARSATLRVRIHVSHLQHYENLELILGASSTRVELGHSEV